MTNIKRNFYILLGISLLACACLIWYAYRANNRAKVVESQVLTLTDTVTIFKNKYGNNVASIRILEASNQELKAILKIKDKTLVKYKTDGVRTITKLVTETLVDTVTILDTIRLPTKTLPLYIKDTIKNRYYNSTITVEGDSMRREFTTFNEYVFVSKDKWNGFFKPKSYVVEVTNLNPYTKTLGLSSYEVIPKKKTGLKISIGLAVGIGAYLLLK